MICVGHQCHPKSLYKREAEGNLKTERRCDSGNKSSEQCARKGLPAKDCVWPPEEKREGNGYFPRAARRNQSSDTLTSVQ